MRLALILCLLLSAGAAFAQQEQNCVALSPGDAGRVRNIRVLSSIPQDDPVKHTLPMIRTQVQPGVGAGTGGIVGAIIGGLIADAIINSQIKKDVERATLAFPALLEEVKDFDFRRQFWSRLDASLESDSRWRVLGIATFDAERGYVEQQDTVRGETVDAILDLRTEYALSADLRVFVMRTTALLQSRPDGRELYRCRYAFVTPPVAAGAYEPAIAAWAADRGALYRAAAVIGMQQTLKMLRYDLIGADAPRPSGEDVRLVGDRGKLVEREEALIIARDSRGALRSVVEAETFSPSAETVASAGRGAGSDAGSFRPVTLDDLMGAMSDEAAAPPKSESPKSAPQPDAGKPARAPDLDDLGGLLGQ